jgi:glycogen debranching enzyme
MFNGWGVHALSENERRYNPIGYHLGTVWRTITRSFPLGSGATDLLKKLVAFCRIGISLRHFASNVGSVPGTLERAIRGII